MRPIDGDALADVLTAISGIKVDTGRADKEWAVTLSAAKNAIAQMPIIKPKKGKWIEDRLVSTGGGTYGVRRCSECEAYYQDVGYGWCYCPNCGARMENGDDSN